MSAQACNFIKKGTLAQVFSCEFCKISKNTFSYRVPPVVVSERHTNADFKISLYVRVYIKIIP